MRAILLIGLLSARAFAGPELSGQTVELEVSRGDACHPEVVTRGLDVPVLLAADAKGRVFSVDTTIVKPRIVRVRQVGVAKPIARLTAEYYDGVLLGEQLVLRGSDELVVVELATGKQRHVAKRVSSLATRNGSLYAIAVDETAAHVNELVLPGFEEKVIATISGRWNYETQLAATASSLFAYLRPDAEVSSPTRSVVESNLVRISLDKSKVAQLGIMHIGTELGASSKQGFAASLTRVARLDANGNATFAPIYGADAIAADDELAVWANGEKEAVVAWPSSGGLPYVACERLGPAVRIAVTPTYIYYMTSPALTEITKPTGVIGRFRRTR